MNERFDFSVEKKSNTQIKKELNKKSRELLRNMPSIITAVILLLVVLMSFAEFDIANMKTLRFAAESGAFMVMSYMIYFAQKNNGKRTGLQDKSYLEKKQEHAEKSKSAQEGDEEDISLFCDWWNENERLQTQRRILAGSGVKIDEMKRYEVLGKKVAFVSFKKRKLERKLEQEKITDEEHELLLELKKIPGEKRVAIVRACLVSKRHVAPSDILSESSDREGRAKTPRGIDRIERTNDFKALASKTVTMILPLVFVPGILVQYDGVATILSMLLKVLSILSTAYAGNYQGEVLYTVDAVENFTIQNNLLDQLEKWRKKMNIQNATEADASPSTENLSQKAELSNNEA